MEHHDVCNWFRRVCSLLRVANGQLAARDWEDDRRRHCHSRLYHLAEENGMTTLAAHLGDENERLSARVRELADALRELANDADELLHLEPRGPTYFLARNAVADAIARARKIC
jgi:hypothetical protein